ncbi:thiol reductant ABC exporter subunit CydC [Paenibacillus albiflavus]|uniref:Thiol reductant ABC exporter subunit CydC n=1 Tax=Paenibacillus albiflavus TaxID=2545760 RepID=A0A4R4EKE9_9BACL|nr:thiol reductant ABC exporter subunit CydC [Paenibacillus albiflavus]TCZ78755.1 thiol reductant ABC exporter subunit CydC [Paenibacillus albiflavus]
MNKEQWLLPYIRAHLGRFIVIVTIATLTVLSAASLMFTSGFLISKSALRPENILMVYVPIVLVRTFGIGKAFVHYVERLVGHDAVLRILAKMRVRLYGILEPQALFIRSRFRTGDVLGVLADDIEHLQNVYLRTIFPSIVALVLYAIAIIALGLFDLQFALLMALYVFILVVVLPVVSLWFTKNKQRQSKQKRSRLYQKLTDAVLGMNDWVISGRQTHFVQTYESDEAEVARAERALSSWARWRTFIGQFIVGATVVSMIYWTGQSVENGKIDVPLVAAFVLVVFSLMDAFLPVSEAIDRIPRYQDSLQRLKSMSEHAASETHTSLHDEAIQQARQEAHIQLERVCFQYDAGQLTVDNVSLDIPQGKKIAIIGRSGAGKSTLLKLIQGALAPSNGLVTINGMPADAYGEHIPSIISVLNQSPHLFDTTVANNIRLGNMDASDEEIHRAAEQVKLDALIQSLSSGYETRMLETGQRFSGGERQRIALARILLQNTPVVILDEPTIGLDPRTEKDLLSTIFRNLEGKSLIWITHHLIGAEHMDEIIFMENGRVVIRGTHDELMEREARYRQLYQLDRPMEM